MCPVVLGGRLELGWTQGMPEVSLGQKERVKVGQSDVCELLCSTGLWGSALWVPIAEHC